MGRVTLAGCGLAVVVVAGSAVGGLIREVCRPHRPPADWEQASD